MKSENRYDGIRDDESGRKTNNETDSGIHPTEIIFERDIDIPSIRTNGSGRMTPITKNPRRKKIPMKTRTMKEKSGKEKGETERESEEEMEGQKGGTVKSRKVDSTIQRGSDVQ